MSKVVWLHYRVFTTVSQKKVLYVLFRQGEVDKTIIILL